MGHLLEVSRHLTGGVGEKEPWVNPYSGCLVIHLREAHLVGGSAVALLVSRLHLPLRLRIGHAG